MNICNKCKIEKPDDQYYTYWHKNFNKHYTRKICNACMLKQKQQHRLLIKQKKKEERKKMIEVLTQQNKVQPVVPELEPEVLKTKKCIMCNEFKSSTEFYQNKQSGYYHTRCKKCHLEYSNKRQHEYYQNKWKTNGGSERILNKPGQFMDRFQEEQVSWLLNVLGWSRTDNGVFIKEGVKEVIDGEIVWPKVPKQEKFIRLRKARTTITKDDIKKIVELRKEGLLMREIAVIYNCSKTTIGDILMKENEKKN